jgi:hypothetical protein
MQSTMHRWNLHPQHFKRQHIAALGYQDLWSGEDIHVISILFLLFVFVLCLAEILIFLFCVGMTTTRVDQIGTELALALTANM